MENITEMSITQVITSQAKFWEALKMGTVIIIRKEPKRGGKVISKARVELLEIKDDH